MIKIIHPDTATVCEGRHIVLLDTGLQFKESEQWIFIQQIAILAPPLYLGIFHTTVSNIVGIMKHFPRTVENLKTLFYT